MRWSASAFDFEQGHGPIYLAREQLSLPTTLLGLDTALVSFAPQLADRPDLALAMARLLRRALDQAPPGWPHVRAATAALRDAEATGS